MKSDNKSWWINCRRQIHLDFHTPEFPPDCFKEFDADYAADTFAKSDVQAVKVFAKGHYGNSFYNTKIGHKHRRLKGDYLAEMTAALHKRKIKVMAYYSVCFDQYTAEQHPDWTQENAQGKKGGWKTWDCLCLNSPYPGKIILPQIEEIVKNYNVDGIWLDIVSFAQGSLYCLCPWCRKKFRGRYNRSLTKKNVVTQLKAFEEFKLESEAEFIKNTRAVIDRYKPGLAFTYNHALYFDSLPEADSAVSFGAQEVHPHNTIYSPEITAAALRTTAKPFECISTSFHFGWGEWTNKTTEQMQYECASIIYSAAAISRDNIYA